MSVPPPAEPEAPRPNFVVFVPDQLRADALGAFGNPHVSTPNIDALAARGTRFEQAYVQHPVCSPSRASFLTGWYPHTAGHRSLTHLLRPSEPNLLKILKEAGYHVTWAGARGDTFAPGATEVSVDEYGFSETPSHAGFGSEWPDDVWTRLFYRGRREPAAAEEPPDFDEAAIRTAEAWLAAPPERPWVLFVPILAPHCPFEAPEPWFSQYDRDAVPEPVPPVDDGLEPGFMQAVRERYGIEEVTAEVWREIIATYYAMVSRMDEHLGRVLAAVDRAGATDATVTLFFADHGEYLGDFGLVEKWPSAMHDCITRDPLIISGGGLPQGQVVHSMVELIDVLPTVLELAGVSAPHRHFGRSLLPVLRDPRAPHRDYAFTEGGFTVEEEPQLEHAPLPYDRKAQLQHDRPELVGKSVAVRDRAWTYVWRLYEKAELYDRLQDPHERINVAALPEHAEVVARMHEAMTRWLVDTADVIPAEEDPRFPEVRLPAPGVRTPAPPQGDPATAGPAAAGDGSADPHRGEEHTR
ncbi:sulfatase-like hydrolase/transferase [Streptomyces sp. NPDC101225]|uniref:sulfatase-like hydrolase/transferase n=1 Tax=Streptomyces sp. NPDC101225 TaxID=3366135 RepID=UPI0037F32266